MADEKKKEASKDAAKSDFDVQKTLNQVQETAGKAFGIFSKAVTGAVAGAKKALEDEKKDKK